MIVTPGQPDTSLLVQRMQSRHAQVQMPPLGSLLPDADAVALIRRWIAAGAVDDTPANAARQYDLEHPPIYTHRTSG